ncbi:hypothetical protein GCM10027426_14760 [Microbacterium lacusdiani]
MRTCGDSESGGEVRGTDPGTLSPGTDTTVHDTPGPAVADRLRVGKHAQGMTRNRPGHTRMRVTWAVGCDAAGAGLSGR